MQPPVFLDKKSADPQGDLNAPLPLSLFFGLSHSAEVVDYSGVLDFLAHRLIMKRL